MVDELRRALGRMILASAIALVTVLPPMALGGDVLVLDTVIRGGTVFDGSGASGTRQDVGIVGDRIVAIGDLSSRHAGRVIDATGLAVVPGFVDIHSHAVRSSAADSGLFRFPDAESYIRQGVTTAIGGPDGGSWLPVSGLIERLEVTPVAINFGTFVGHNTVRAEVMGRVDRAPSGTELAAMRGLVAAAMEDGAFGLSSGLQYIPGAYSDTDEVIALAAVAARYGGIYITHMRHEGRQLLDSVNETIRIGREAGLPAQVTHHKAMGVSMWGKSVDSLALVDAALAEGLDIGSDVYPYTASSTGIRVMFPSWALEGDRATREARFRDPDTRQAVLDGLVDNLANDRAGDDLGRVVIANCSWAPENNGKSLGELLDERDIPRSLEAAAELVLELELGGTCSAIYHTMDEADVIRFMQHPTTMIASDGGVVMPGPDVPHPRNYGAFARVLARYVRDLDALSLSDAIHKMSALPADRLGLLDRGRIAPGAFADIAVLDPETVTDRATFDEPHQFAVGVRHVLVNGEPAMLDGELTGNRPGRPLRHGQTTLAAASEPENGPVATRPLRVLFAGNSFSFYNNGIHTHFRNLLRSADETWVASSSVKMSTISGGTLAQQGPALDLLLEQYDWDVVVLQGHSREPVDPERSAVFSSAAVELSARVRAAGARPVLFMTWGYRDQPDMIEPLSRAYLAAAESAGADVAPVGWALDAARKALPGTDFFAADGRHPSLAATYLAANVFYARLVGSSPEPLGYDAGLDPETARALRQLAWQAASANHEPFGEH
ncbi:amidohydrolase family protein [Marinihelvus fidelis]|nr:amidohydrolase family protein [Marinihelvus fidelis]